MRIIVTPDADGVVSKAGVILGQVLADSAIVVDFAGTTLDIPPTKAARLNEAGNEIEIVDNWIDSGPWYDQEADTAHRLTPIEITDYGVVPASTWAMTPRPETAAEKKTREKEDADRVAQAEKVRVAKISVSDVQFAIACQKTGLITADEAVAWAASGVLPAGLETAIETLPPDTQFVARIKASGSKTFDRSSPFVALLATALGMTEEQMDVLFVAASMT